MNKITPWLLILGFLISAMPAHAEREIAIGYQGVIESRGNLLDGTGFFKFVLCNLDCITTYWSNDSSSTAGIEPLESVPVGLESGIFNLMLGDTSLENMAELPISIFEDVGDETLYLRVWFDDAYNGFEQLEPDQRLSLVPYAVKTELTGDLLTVASMDMNGNLNLRADDLASSGGLAFKIADSANTLFSVDENGTAFSRDLTLHPLTSSSDLNRVVTGRIYYNGDANKFMGCNNSSCAEIGLAGSSGVADITSVTAGSGLSGGGTAGNATLSVDTATVVTKTGDHTMSGSLTASAITAPTITSSTTINAAALTATGAVSANALTATTTATTGGVTMPPTGTSAGNTAELQFKELAATGPHYVGLKAPDSILMNKIWVLPAADGTAGQILSTDGSGTLSWATDIHEGGDITAVTPGTGLDPDGGASSGIAMLSFDYTATLASNTLAGGTEIFYSSEYKGGILFEGEEMDDVEGRLTVAEPTTTDKTWTLPDATGTILLNTNCTSVVAGEFDPTETGATDDYLNLVENLFSATETDEDMFMVPIAMTARNLRAEVNVAPGAGNDPWTITLRDDAAGTTLTCQIDELSTNCSDTTNAPSIAAGSKLTIQVTSSGGDADPTAAAAMTVSFCLGV
jgi:hypothetical protein